MFDLKGNWYTLRGEIIEISMCISTREQQGPGVLS